MTITFSQPSIPWPGKANILPVQGPGGPCLMVPIEVDWDGTNPTQILSLLLAGVGQLGPVQSVWVNNELCGAQVRVIALDTQQVVTVPPYSCGMYSLPSYSGNFVVSTNYDTGSSGSSPYAAAPSVTYLNLYNVALPPTIGPSSPQNTQALTFSVGLASGSFNDTLLANTITGTLFCLDMIVADLVGATGGTIFEPIELVDGDGNVFLRTSCGAASGVSANATLFRLSNWDHRFFKGITLTGTLVGTAPATGRITLTGSFSRY